MYGRRDFGGNREEAGARTVWVESLPGYVDEEFLRHQLGKWLRHYQSLKTLATTLFGRLCI